jgi:hypothetical protein
MEINRTPPRNLHLENSPKAEERNRASFAKPDAEVESGVQGVGLGSGITRADLGDPRKTEEILKSCFSELVDQSSGQQGVALPDVEKQRVVDFLAADPTMRRKLLNHLEQVVT